MRPYCKSFQRDRKSGFDHYSNELVVDYIPLQTVNPSFKLQPQRGGFDLVNVGIHTKICTAKTTDR